MRRAARPTRWLRVALIANAAACADERRHVVFTGDTAVAEMAAIIGESDGAEEYTFGKIASVAADGSGTVYVADGIGSAVMAYDPQGKFLGKLGREGRGPGEFRYIRDLTTVDDRLLVRGAFKTSEFRRRQQSRFADSLIREWSIRGLDSPLASRAKASRHLYITPSYTYRDFLIRGYFYAVFDTLGM